MNSEAYRAVWQSRYAGTLDGGPALLVALAMAEMAEPGAGAVSVGVRALAGLTGYGSSTVRRAITEAGLFKMADAGGGRRPARYVLACPPRRATSVDNPFSVSPTARNSAPREAISAPLARHTGPVACPPWRAQLEPKTLNREVCAPGLDEPAPPAEVAANVAELRRRMNGKGGP